MQSYSKEYGSLLVMPPPYLFPFATLARLLRRPFCCTATFLVLIHTVDWRLDTLPWLSIVCFVGSGVPRRRPHLPEREAGKLRQKLNEVTQKKIKARAHGRGGGGALVNKMRSVRGEGGRA